MDYRYEASDRPGARRSSSSNESASRVGFGRYTSQNSKKGLLGLANLGNTCFMNAALQCLTHVHGLQKYFRFCNHALASKGQSNRQKLVTSFAHWFEQDWGRDVAARHYSPQEILKYVQQLNPIFQGYAQQDSQEFLRCVLDNLHEELRREVPGDLSEHLLRCFGLEAPGEAAAATAAALPGPAPAELASEDASPTSGQRRTTSPTAPSATRQLMQLCQSTEGMTDVDEIRLPWKPTPMARGGDDLRAGRATELPEQQATPAAEHSCAAGGEAAQPAEKENALPSTQHASIISELFQGKVVSMVRCLECQKTSRTEEVIYDVSVPIPSANEPRLGGHGSVAGSDVSPRSSGNSNPSLKGPSWSGMLAGIPGRVKSWFHDKGVDVTDCMRKYCAAELLGGKDKYFCEHCQRKNDCEKRIAFKELPETLCVHIKRFRYDAGWFNGTKNSRVVNFPVSEVLDLAPFLEEEAPQQPTEYRLVGLIQHMGSMGGGHYIAYCQHKRKPGEWYEFDDLQVTLVKPEQVERAEPYVLFYQRVASRAARLDCQTFKTDMRRVEAQVRQHLASGEAIPPSISQTPQASEELQLYRRPPERLGIAFVTKHWYVRLTAMSQPGPIDNFEHLCPHGMLGCDKAEAAAEPFLPISQDLFLSLQRKYGGGPLLTSLDVCPKCKVHLHAYNERKQAEFDLVSKYDTKDTGDGRGWYLVDASWVSRWKRYVRSEQVSNVRDMCAPGPITNGRLLDAERPGQPRSGLRLRIDYIGVNARVWWLFTHVHGGGPALCREELDIYSNDFPVETELQLDELRGRGASAFALRTSRQLVDECLGDLALYEQRYGSGAGGDSGPMATEEEGGRPEDTAAEGEPC